MSTPALEIQDLHKHFRSPDGTQVRAVDGLNLHIERGEVVALLGANGAGKTTTLDMVLGLTQPSSGSVSVLGGKPKTAVQRGAISAVLQTGGLLGDLSVEETVKVIAGMYASPLPVAEAMQRADITEIARRRVSRCSGGEQQRVRFALALLPQPEVLVLDEPTAGMDVNARAAFWNTMHEYAAGGQTVIFATHYLQEAENFANRIVVMNRGRCIADGSVSEIRALGGSRRVSAVLPGVTEQQLAAFPEHQIVSREGDQITFAVADSDEFARYLLTQTPAQQLGVTAASLDEAFSHLVDDANAPATEAELIGAE